MEAAAGERQRQWTIVGQITPGGAGHCCPMSGLAEEAVWPPLIVQKYRVSPLIGQSGLQCPVQVKNLTILLLSDTEEEITHLDGLQTLIKEKD